MEFLAAFGWRRAFTALAALLIAFGVGYLMQSVFVEHTPMATVDELPDAAPILRSADRPRALPTPPAATLVPLVPPPVMPDRVHKPDPSDKEAWDDAKMSPFGFSCDPTLELKPRDAAMISVKLFAPCDPDRVMTFRHESLEIELATDSFGRASTMLPALDTEATVSVEAGGHPVREVATVPDARAFSRVAIIWEGPQVFRMNAYELGAKRGETGHIWSGSAKTPARAMRGTGGFLIQLGDESGRSAEV